MFQLFGFCCAPHLRNSGSRNHNRKQRLELLEPESSNMKIIIRTRRRRHQRTLRRRHQRLLSKEGKISSCALGCGFLVRTSRPGTSAHANYRTYKTLEVKLPARHSTCTSVTGTTVNISGILKDMDSAFSRTWILNGRSANQTICNYLQEVIYCVHPE